MQHLSVSTPNQSLSCVQLILWTIIHYWTHSGQLLPPSQWLLTHALDIWLCQARRKYSNVPGDGLVFAVGKLNLRVLWQHHMLLQLHVILQSYFQVFVKSYNFVFEKINIEYVPHKKLQKSRWFSCSENHCTTDVHVCCLKTATWNLRFCTTSLLLSNVNKYVNDVDRKGLFYGSKKCTVKN